MCRIISGFWDIGISGPIIWNHTGEDLGYGTSLVSRYWQMSAEVPCSELNIFRICSGRGKKTILIQPNFSMKWLRCSKKKRMCTLPVTLTPLRRDIHRGSTRRASLASTWRHSSSERTSWEFCLTNIFARIILVGKELTRSHSIWMWQPVGWCLISCQVSIP